MFLERIKSEFLILLLLKVLQLVICQMSPEFMTWQISYLLLSEYYRWLLKIIVSYLYYWQIMKNESNDCIGLVGSVQM